MVQYCILDVCCENELLISNQDLFLILSVIIPSHPRLDNTLGKIYYKRKFNNYLLDLTPRELIHYKLSDSQK
jgi:hypothetical protein